MSEYIVASCSGGKDSTAMVLKELEMGGRIDEIVFCNVAEWPQAVDTVRKLSRETGIKLTELKSDKPFEYWLADHVVTKGPHAGRHGYGWPTPRNRWCTSNMKARVVGQYFRDLKAKMNVVQLIGICADETHRVRDDGTRQDGMEVRQPLVKYGMRERDSLPYCYAHGYDFGGLYNEVARLSCWCCPLQSLPQLRNLYENHPELWAELKRLDAKSYNSFRYDYTLDELERKFDRERQAEESQGALFEWEDQLFAWAEAL